MQRAARQMRYWLLLSLGFLAGCSLFSPAKSTLGNPLQTTPAVAAVRSDPSVQEIKEIQQTAFQEKEKADTANPAKEGAAEQPEGGLPSPTPIRAPAAQPPTLITTSCASAAPESPFKDADELAVDALVEAVLARNPTLPQMRAAWEAAWQRYPQVISLDDPLLQGGATPSIFGGEGLHGGWQATLSQKYPWPGKLRLRGERTLAEARAAANDVDDVRLRLIESARIAFYDYYLVYRAIAVNNEAIRLLEEFRNNAMTRYKTAPKERRGLQDVLLADVELGRTRERGLLLEQARQIALARLNTLLNLPPDLPLPPPPATVRVEDGLPPVEQLRSVAVSRRPELQALVNRIAAQQAALDLARKEYYPDFNVIATYNTLWQPALQQPLVGVQMNLPVRLAKRAAAVREAHALIFQLRAKLTDQTNQVNFEVQQAYAQVEQGKKAVRLYEQSVLRSAELNVKSSQASYITGSIPFLTLIEAEREVIKVRDRYYELIAEYYRRLSTLDRVIGGPQAPGGEAVCPEHAGTAPPLLRRQYLRTYRQTGVCPAHSGAVPAIPPAAINSLLLPAPGQPGYPIGLGSGGR